jgi:hypothetical protein
VSLLASTLPGPCLHYIIDATAYSVLRSPRRNVLLSVRVWRLTNQPNPAQKKKYRSGNIQLLQFSLSISLCCDLSLLSSVIESWKTGKSTQNICNYTPSGLRGLLTVQNDHCRLRNETLLLTPIRTHRRFACQPLS